MGSVDSGGDGLAYTDVSEWVADYFVRLVGDAVGYRPGEQVYWCREWWRHPGAVVRLDALWQAWEDLRRNGGVGISVWFLDHADPHVRVLLSASGPFRHCSIERGHRPTAPLPIVTPPEEVGLFLRPQAAETR